MNKIKNFYELDAWKRSHELVLLVYRITKRFPREEVYGLSSQMRRAAVSITSNIAEGFNRGFPKEKSQFYRFSLGSITEIQNQLIISRDVNYISNSDFNDIFQSSILAHKLINGLLRSAQSRI